MLKQKCINEINKYTKTEYFYKPPSSRILHIFSLDAIHKKKKAIGFFLSYILTYERSKIHQNLSENQQTGNSSVGRAFGLNVTWETTEENAGLNRRGGIDIFIFFWNSIVNPKNQVFRSFFLVYVRKILHFCRVIRVVEFSNWVY